MVQSCGSVDGYSLSYRICCGGSGRVSRPALLLDVAHRAGYSTPHPAGVNMLRKATYRVASDAGAEGAERK